MKRIYRTDELRENNRMIMNHLIELGS
jgi:hypothetical protein